MIKSSVRMPSSDAPQAVVPTASPYTYTNNSGSVQVVNVTGGTIMGVTLVGLALGITGPTNQILRPGDSITISYLVAPTIRVTNL